MPTPGEWGYFDGYNTAVYCDVDPIGTNKTSRQGNSTFTGIIIDIAKGVKDPVEYKEKIPINLFWPKKGLPTESTFFKQAEVLRSTWVQKQIKLQEAANSKKLPKNYSTSAGASSSNLGISNNDENEDDEIIDEEYWAQNDLEGMLMNTTIFF